MKKLPSIYAFPNNDTIFPHTYTQREFEDIFAERPLEFAYAAFPLTKHRWRGAFVCLRDDTFMLSTEAGSGAEEARTSQRRAEAFAPETTDTRELLHYSGGRAMTFECYSFLKCKPGVRISALDLDVQRGLVVGGNRMKIFSSGVYAPPSASVGILGNTLPFERVQFASLRPGVQATLFSAWVARRPVVITGGTGVGKTSQVPKLMMWFNFLFGGFKSLEELGSVRERPCVLSLPRVALVRLNAQSLLRSLGFEQLTGAPVSMRYGSMPAAETNSEAPTFGLVLSTNKLTLSTLFEHGTVVLDEIHEHDQMTDIIIAVLRKHMARIDTLVMMSATLEDDRERLEEFFPNAEFVHIEGPFLFEIKNVYVRNTADVHDTRRYMDEEKRNIVLALRRHRPAPGHGGILFVASVAQCEDYARTVAREHPTLAVFVVHGKAENIDATLAAAAGSSRASLLVSTPYLESSVTLPHVSHIYDTGRVFIPMPFGGRQTIISRAMMAQRRGRVGRVMPGTYVYFYDPALLRPIKRINTEFLYNYIIYAWHFGLRLPDDLYVQPDDLDLLQRSEEYLRAFGISAERLFSIAARRYLKMVEYAKIYARSGDHEELDQFERGELVTDDVLQSIRRLNLAADVKSAYMRHQRYVHTCVVRFGPYAGTEFKLSHSRRLRGRIYMVTERTFIL
uniref:RNA helicase NPH-II n=1 Tax=Rousettus bat poxvirus TaxID=3141933 RepID=A0AAU7E2B3_9POXV